MTRLVNMKPRHKRALLILGMLRDGMRAVEIAHHFKIHRSTVYQERDLALRLERKKDRANNEEAAKL